jgi:GH15 family glucan-1,4-alpha-glucosidase
MAFEGSANGIQAGLNARLDWNGENTDSSQLGIIYPWETHSPTDPRAARVVDRINGVAADRFGNIHPLVNYAGFFNNGMGWTDLINRYWNDGYWGNGSSSSPWGAGPWFLTTMWYGMYYAYRQDFTPGTGDIDNHKYRLDLLLNHLGPVGLGSEQIAARGIPGHPGAARPARPRLDPLPRAERLHSPDRVAQRVGEHVLLRRFDDGVPRL